MSNMSKFDILFKEAQIYDGTGAPPFKGSVGVKGERINMISEPTQGSQDDARTVIEARGLALVPGFIDVHNHADLSILYYPKAESFARQGITSFVGGHCGDSPGPYGDYIGEPWFYREIYEDARPRMDRQDWLIPREMLNAKHREVFGWEIDWKTMGEFLKKVGQQGLSLNYVPLVGHGTIRSYVMETDFKRYATKKEIKEMRELTEQAMLEGCRGLSVGRTYEPGSWASFDEVLACAKVAAKYGGIYNSHCLRSAPRGDKKPGELPPNPLHGVEEVISIAKKAEISVQISHLGNSFVVQPPDNDIMTEAAVRATLHIVDNAVNDGLNVNFDVIPHHQTGGIFTTPYLIGVLSQWLRIAGTPGQMAKALLMEDLRDEIKARIDSGKIMNLNPMQTPDWAQTRIIRECKDTRFLNRSIAKIAEELKLDPLDTLFKIIMADPWTRTETTRTKDDRAKLEYFRHPRMMIGVDTFAVDDKNESRHPPWLLPNENAFGGMARYLRRAARETKILTLQEAIRKITSLPATKFRMSNRGILKVGAYADIVVMNPETISDQGSQIEPRIYAKGIEYVTVNGSLVVRKGEHTGALPGKVLYREVEQE